MNIKKFREAEESIIDFNILMKLDYIDSTQSMEYLTQDKVTGEMADLPGFLETILLAQFDPKLPSKQKDVRMSTIFGTYGNKLDIMTWDDREAFQVKWKSWSETYHIILNSVNNSISKGGLSVLDASIARANVKEMRKLQLLIGAPLNHHILSLENHYTHYSPPSSFSDYNWSWVKDLADLMRSKKIVSSSDISWKLPIGTSQGLTLKSARDTPLWRAFSKVLLASYAYKSTTAEHLKIFKTEVNKLMQMNGYSDIAQHAMLGLRRQQIGFDKEEPFPVNESLTSSGLGTIKVTRKIQGRARAIFPFSETIKAWFKGIADSVKKHLFDVTDLCSTDPNVISRKLHVITALSIKHKLFKLDEDQQVEGWLPFYDLSAYDRSTHQGLNSLYNEFLSIFESEAWQKCKGMHDDAGILYPTVLERSSIYELELIEGRSTLSGQADVTVKNNIIHIIMICQSLATALDKDPIVIANALLYREGALKDSLIGMIHGDDAAIFMGTDPKIYEIFNATFTSLGVEAGAEDAPVYLKKVPHSKIVEKLLLDKNLNVHSSITGLIGSLVSDVDMYNKQYLGGMQPLLGSILKNRFGEYSISDIALHIVSLRDTYRLLLGQKEIASVTKLYDIMLDIYSAYHYKYYKEDVELDGIFKCLKSGAGYSSENLGPNPTLDKELQAYMLRVIETNTPQSTQLRAMVSKLYYAFGEEFLGEELQSIFALSNYDLEEEMVVHNVERLSREQTLELILKFQQWLLDSQGEAPSELTIKNMLSQY